MAGLLGKAGGLGVWNGHRGTSALSPTRVDQKSRGASRLQSRGSFINMPEIQRHSGF